MLSLAPYENWKPSMLNHPREQHAYEVIEQAVKEYKLDAVYALLSGGHDSLTATYIASQHPKFAGCIHAETRTGYIANEVTKFVVEVCKQYNWHLIKKHPATSYIMLVADYGFPGAARHMFMYRYLKERPIAAAKKEATKRSGKRIGFITGMRRQESVQRADTEPFHKVKSDYFIAPIYDWSKQECEALINRRDIPLNPVSLALGISGECGCGSHAAKSERKLSELLFAEQARWLASIEKLVQAAYELQQLEVEMGIREPEKMMKPNYLRWGHGRSVANEQTMMPGFALCNGCVNKAAENGENGEDPDMMLRVAQLERLAG